MWANDGIFVHAVGTSQEYCGRIFSRPICFVMASFWTTSHTVLEGTTLAMYSQSAKGPELFFPQAVCFVLFFSAYVFSLKWRKNQHKKILNVVLR